MAHKPHAQPPASAAAEAEAPRPAPEPQPETFQPFTPPRQASVWVLGPSGPVREE
jgi:hypothetical protein